MMEVIILLILIVFNGVFAMAESALLTYKSCKVRCAGTVHPLAMNADTITFTTKGQVVIPAAIRRKFGIESGTKAAVTITDEGIFIRPITREYIRSLRGSLKGKGVLRGLMADRKHERDR